MNVIGILLLVLGATDQASPRDKAAEPREGTAIVRGRVTDAESGAPLARVDLSLSLLGARVQWDTVSDAKGAFEFTRLPAGTYSVLADPTRRGTTHRPASYRTAQQTAGGEWTTIVLRDGEIFDAANIALARGYVIAVRVLDEDGIPVADALVEAEAIEARGSFSTRSRTTDDLGAVRLWGYSPGLYRVCATPRSRDSSRHSSEGYIKTCYPSEFASEAQAVAITSVDPPEVQIRLRRTRLFQVSGVAVDANGQPASRAIVSLAHVDRDGVSSRTIQNGPEGFIARSLEPGEYFVSAEMASDSNSDDDMTRPIGSVAVRLQSADVDNIVVVLSPPPIVRGRLVFEGAPPPPASSLTVVSFPARRMTGWVTARRSPTARVNADLSFELRGMFGPRTIDVAAPPEWVVKSVNYHGEERVNVPTEFRTEDGRSSLEITLTSRAATLLARVQGTGATDPATVRVLLFPADPNQWNSTGRMSIWRMGVRKEDVYEFRRVRPGQYFVAVIPDGMPFRDGNVRLLEELSKTAERITLLENDQRTIDLRK